MSDNLSPRSVSKRQTQVASYDLNGDGVLDADEYKLLRYDKDGDGQLDQEELALASKEDTQFTFRASGDRCAHFHRYITTMRAVPCSDRSGRS